MAIGSGTIYTTAATPVALRVCADPNNLPFSNARGQGFENKIAAVVAADLGRPVSYFWSPSRRGFIRNTLGAERCDVVMSVPVASDRVAVTRPYYRSTYVFVTRRGTGVASLDDPRLRTMRIGIQLTGDDYDNPPAAQSLASRHIIDNVRGFTVYGDYSVGDPNRLIVDAVARGDVDVAIVWGPLAGYYARREPVRMALTPVTPESDGPALRFRFALAMGVRKGDAALRDQLDRAVAGHTLEIKRILTSYGVPLL
jgi:quinoprotein dehydrogenase-associated probable ABC transporter substrate-binding protein